MRASVLAAAVGIGLRSVHVADVIATRPAVAWLEVHAENYMASGGPTLAALERIRESYPVAIHAVGLSLGSADPLDARHLRRLRALVERIQPALVSDHLSWSSLGGRYVNHLLPLPYTDETLHLVCDHVAQAQDALGRRLLVENPSSYLRFRESPIPEPDFLADVVRHTGCGLLCDVNNVYVSACNLGLDPVAYLDALPVDAIEEFHLAGHSVNDADGVPVLIDDHGARVAPEVWALFAQVLARSGPRPTLIEWDANIPELSVLVDEARRADAVMEAHAVAP
ncbi:MAG: hypothetical protein DMD90_06580 [Candidatus Rokuibacteriota bacterium]|nr:MAG: hypothetical protein AUH76_15475 [Candidatus Rokubacteria bacterium 13_1_40CM_4_67_11]OLD32036.1 MAG: hypothetical protein AUI49_04255 [Candidatus Rokubacteria bacterium 13_1_40CM_2_68_13]PYN67102.1 MAG: hypothetical protein DMD90_06580 [Candidatus Rokubacteria bacterium]